MNKAVIDECPICKNTSITTFGGINNVSYGLVKLDETNKMASDTYLPLVVNVCKKCGHVEFRLYPSDKSD